MENIVHKGKLEELAQRVKVGFVGTCEKYYTDDSGIPMLRTTNLKANGIELDDLKYVTEEFHNKNIKSQLHEGDVLVARFGTSGQACVYHGGVAQCLNAIIIEPKLDICVPEYLALVINSDNIRRQINKKIVGSTQNILNTKVLSNIEIELPSIEEQTYILSVFSKVNNVLMNRTNELQLLDNLIKARFVELFGDPNVNDKNWVTGIINDIGTCVAGATPSTKVNEYWDNGTIPWMSSGEVNKGRVFETDTYITQMGYDNASTKLVPPKTVVLAMAGQGKTRGMAAITEIELCTNQSICSIVNNEKIDAEYLLCYLKLQYKELRRASTNTDGRGGLNLKIIGNYPVMIPPIDLQNQFADFVRQVDKSKFVA